MTAQIALSGLKAAQSDMSATSNNIANVGTIGFHSTRTEFADIYSASPYAGPSVQKGMGTQVTRFARDFSQGSLTTTENTFDLALQGAGFFRLVSDGANGQVEYSRAGAFGMDSEGYVVNANGSYLTAYPTATDGSFLGSYDAQPLQVPSIYGDPVATTTVDFNLAVPTGTDAQGTQAAVPSALAFDPLDPTSYAQSTQINILDDQGQPMDAMVYLVMDDAPDAGDPTSSYTVHLMIDGIESAATGANTLSFDADGLLVSGVDAMDFNVAGDTVSLNLSGSTMTQGAFEVTTMNHDGQVAGSLRLVEVDETGVVWASYGDDTNIALGMIAVGNFINPGGLRELGNSSYAETRDSGAVTLGQIGTNGLGRVRSGALERSNVDLTEELVNLISAQRNYQASAKALETNQSLLQTIMNIRS